MVESPGLLDGDQKTGQWDFTDAKELLLWCNGRFERALKAAFLMCVNKACLFVVAG